jgi:uncharacterized protein YneF (UPF0154 family)
MKLTIRTSSLGNKNLLVNGASISSREVARALRGTVVVMVEMEECGNVFNWNDHVAFALRLYLPHHCLLFFMSASRKTGPSRKSGRLASLAARSDATPQLTTLVGPSTPSPSKQKARRHEGSDYDPDGSPQSSAHVIKYIYGKPPLNENEKKAVEQAMEACGATNRCIITNEEVHNFCHLVGRKTSEAQVRGSLFQESSFANLGEARIPEKTLGARGTFHNQRTI